jgi:hypothetical protein
MATYYLDTFVGVADGTSIPADKADGRKVNAKVSTTHGNKVSNQGWAAGDVVYAGKLRAGEFVRAVFGITDTSLGTTTLSLGTLANPTKYVNAKTLTVTDIPTALGPKAATAVAGPVTADETLYWTIGTTAVAAAVNLQLGFETASVK